MRAFRIVAGDGGTEHWITDDPAMDELGRQELDELSWSIEEFRWGLKQHCGVESCQARVGRAQQTHVGLALRAFVRLEWQRWDTGVSWLEAKSRIVRDVVRSYLAAPRHRLTEVPTASLLLGSSFALRMFWSRRLCHVSTNTDEIDVRAADPMRAASPRMTMVFG